MKFKKITAIAAGALLVGMTMSSAVVSGLSPSDNAIDAVVYGSQADADQADAESIADWLELSSSSTGSLSGDGDQYKIERTSTKLNLGYGMQDVKSTSITDSNMPNLLKDGTYYDDDNDEFEYTQEVDLGNATFNLWENGDYKDDVPTLGFEIANSDSILNYTLSFSDDPYFTDLTATELTIMGKEYFILRVDAPGTNTTLTLLDSAESTVLKEGQTKTVAGHEVTIDWIDGTDVVLDIDGTKTNSLSATETQSLRGSDSYVGIKDVRLGSRDSDIGQVEFSIGEGKLVLKDGSTVELNSENIDGVTSHIGGQGTDQITSITIEWKANDDVFLADDAEITLPGFEAIKMAFTGMTFPEEKTIKISGGDAAKLENVDLKSGVTDIDIAYWDQTNDWIDAVGDGTGANDILYTTNSSNITMDYDTERMFIASWSDGSSAESYLMRITAPDSSNKTDFEYKKGDTWATAKADASEGDDFTLGQVEITVGIINDNENTVNFWRGNTNMDFMTLYTESGLKIDLPYRALDVDGNELSFNASAANYSADLAACNAATSDSRIIGNTIYYNYSDVSGAEVTGTCAQDGFNLTISEEDENSNIAAGGNISVYLNQSGTDHQIDVQEYLITATGAYDANGPGIEEGSSDKYVNYLYSKLATKLVWDRSSDLEELEITYHDGESYGNLYVIAPEVSATTTGSMIFTDSESGWKNYNVVLVGGSCINTATATALGVSSGTCGPDFTDATDVGEDHYLIQTVGNAFVEGKIALVVAGYDKEDTDAAASKLVADGDEISITEGTKYIGTVGVTAGKSTLVEQ